ncbi:MAG: substrate-binding domain-containing protein [Anaerolineae bacterium]|nr:substrate-binding domain-containing protein [Anaerolineae bacterium]
MTQIVTNPLNRRPTIGLVINTIERTARHMNGQKVWLGVMDAAKERDVNLLCFHVDFMSKQPPDDTAKTLYKLIDAQNVDGLITFLYWNQETFEQHCSRFSADFPIVNLRRQFDGFSTVIQDDYQGMRDTMTHLVEDHGYRRIAYIRGEETNGPCQNRYRAYLDALAAYDLPFQEELVSDWSLNQSAMGKEGIRLLLDERQLKPGVDFDAIAVTNDRRAMGVLDALSERGVSVPYDVAVIAFDDIAGSEFTNPPLTSMALPYYEMGKQAAETLFAEIAEKETKPKLVLARPTLILRESCGCLPAAVTQVALKPAKAPQTDFETAVITQKEAILAAMIQSASGNKIVATWAERVFDAFVNEVENGRSGQFLEKLDKALRPMMTGNQDVFAWQTAISAMRSHLQAYLQNPANQLADDLWQQASVFIGKMAYREQKHQILRINDQAELLRTVSAKFVTLFDIDQLMDRLAEDLKTLGIPSSYLSLYEDAEAPGENARLILAVTEQGRVQTSSGEYYPSRQLLPDNLFPQDRQASFVIESLHFRDQPLGFALFEVGPQDGNIYAILGKEISSALQGSLLVEHMRRRAEHLQAAVEVTEAVTKVLDPKELVQQVVDLIRERFDLYYVGLFLIVEGRRLDPNPKKYAMLQAGTGEAGRTMVAKGHRLEVDGKSMIGQCVATGEPCIALDVGEASAYFANPLLPETRSELALPLISRGEVIGALGLQSARKSAFDQEDAAIFQTMASQLASAIENARLFSQAEEAMNKLQSELRAQVRDGWNRYMDKRK